MFMLAVPVFFVPVRFVFSVMLVPSAFLTLMSFGFLLLEFFWIVLPYSCSCWCIERNDKPVGYTIRIR